MSDQSRSDESPQSYLSSMLNSGARPFECQDCGVVHWLSEKDRLALAHEHSAGAAPMDDGCECHGGTEVASCDHCVVLAESASIDVERLAEALKVELNRTHEAGKYVELAESIVAEYRAPEGTDR